VTRLRLLDRMIGRLGAAQYFHEQPRPLPVDLSEARAMAALRFFRWMRQPRLPLFLSS